MSCCCCSSLPVAQERSFPGPCSISSGACHSFPLYWHPVLPACGLLQQHGFNAVLMLAELALSRIPASFFLSGPLALWLSAFAAWSTLFFVRTGRRVLCCSALP